eukprot:768646-Hanusia_phi.AAC.11
MRRLVVGLIILLSALRSGTMPCGPEGRICRCPLRLRGGEEQEQTSHVSPFSVQGETDYDKIITLFGSKVFGGDIAVGVDLRSYQAMEESLIGRLERVTGRPAHHLIRRNFAGSLAVAAHYLPAEASSFLTEILIKYSTCTRQERHFTSTQEGACISYMHVEAV